MPPTFEWGFAGDVELMQESAAAMGLAMILAVAFIYIVLASQFESFLQPMIIMLSLPLALVGALLLLLATGKNLGMPAMIGVVMLMGLVTKNAILLVDYTNQLRRDGLPLKDALLSAGPVRLRPIVMTTVAMILGMLPSALGTGDGSEFRSPIAIATIGGLLTSTLLTLVVVPVAYLLLEGAVERVRAWRQAPMPAGVHAAARVAGCPAAPGSPRRVSGRGVGFRRNRERADGQDFDGRSQRTDEGRRPSELWPADDRSSAGAGPGPQRGSEGDRRTPPRESGERRAGAGRIPAVARREFPLHTDAGVAGAAHSRGDLRPDGADVPREPDSRERRALRRHAAGLYRRQAGACLWCGGGGAGGEPARPRACAANADASGIRNVLCRTDGRPGRANL